MILLDSTRHSAASPVAVALLLGVLGLLAIWGGMRIRNARIPNFVTTYTGRASGALTLPFTGICLLQEVEQVVLVCPKHKLAPRKANHAEHIPTIIA